MSPLRRIARARMLEPLRERDFALLAGASAVSLFGDGFFYVALAWQVYEISNVPTALSLVGVAWTLPLTVFLLLGGAFSDRYDRRLLMVASDLVRAGAIGAIGVLSITDVIQLWHLIALIGLVGIGDAFFNPASAALVPDVVPAERLTQANALAAMYRPLMVRLLGPALGGLVVGLLGPGVAFGFDAATFIVSAAAVAAIRRRPGHVVGRAGLRRTLSDIGEGLRFVRATPWCWATLVAAMLSLLVFFGPVEVLVPYLVKNRLELGPEALGTIFAFGGMGSIAAAIAIGQRGLPRRRITAMYVSWSVGVALMAVYGVMTSLWQALLASLLLHALFEVGSVIWVTLLQQLVPRRLLGRVVSLDWLVSTGLVPVSFALTGPVADAFGPSPTMVAAALVGAIFMGALLFVPGVRDPERTGATERPIGVVPEGSGH